MHNSDVKFVANSVLVPKRKKKNPEKVAVNFPLLLPVMVQTKLYSKN